MKILFITYSRAMLGANKSMVDLILDLKIRYGVDASVLMGSENDGNLSEILQQKNIPFFIFPMKHWVVSENASLKYLRGFSTWIKNNMNIRNIKKKINLKEYDLIYTNNSTVQTGAYLAKSMHLPHIWHVREFGNDYGIVFNYPSGLVNKWFRNADRVIAVSKSLEKHVKSDYGQGSNVCTVYNGVVSNASVESRTFYNEQILHFCYVGTLQNGKNQLELLRAAKVLLNSGEKRFHVNLVGVGKEYKQLLSDYVRDYDLHEYVTFWGYRSDVMEILKTMDVGVICSKAEAFGRVTCEYMAASMPVIGVNEAGTSEIVTDRENGLLYTLGDVDELANCMKQFIEHPEIIREYGEKARHHVMKNYTIQANTDAIYEVIRSVVDHYS